MKHCICFVFMFCLFPLYLFPEGGVENIIFKRIDNKLLPEDTVGIHDFLSFFLPVSNISITKDGKKKASVVTEQEGGIIKEGGGISPRIVVEDVSTNIVKFTSGYPSSGPKWSPNGEWLAYCKMPPLPGKFFQGRQTYGDAELWTWKEGQSGEILTPGLSVSDFFWTPNSKTILFDVGREKEKSFKTYLMTVNVLNGTLNEIDEIARFTSVGYSLSPDGSMVAYVKVLKEELHTEWIPVESDVYVSNIDGSGKKRLVKTGEVETYLKWISNNKILVDQWKFDKPERQLWDQAFVYFILETENVK